MKEKNRFLIFIEIAVCLVFFLFSAAFSARGFAKASVRLSAARERDEAVLLCETLAEAVSAFPTDVDHAAAAVGAEIITDEAGVSLITLKGSEVVLSAEHERFPFGRGSLTMSVVNGKGETVYTLDICLFEGEQSQ